MATPASPAPPAALRPQAPPHDAGEDADARLAEARRAIDAGEVDVLSLDVFDTLLYRTVDRPDDAFARVGEVLRERGLRPAAPDDAAWARLRARAERVARDEHDAEEVTLREIHERMAAWLRAPGVDAAAAAAAELDVEDEILRADRDVAALVAHARERGVRVVAVSDIYLSGEDLRRLLDRPPLDVGAFERIFASSDHRTGKGGGLFPVVLEALSVAPGRVLHLGDNHAADVEAAERTGVRGVWFPQRSDALEEVRRRERRHRRTEPPVGDLGLTALRGKAEARAHGLAGRDAELWTYGATVAGPLLHAFAAWVREQARARGMRRVHCLMREGALLAPLIAAGDVDAVPLWISRTLALRASLVDVDEPELRRLLTGRQLPTVARYCGLLGLAPDDLGPELAGSADRRLAEAGLGDAVIARVCGDEALRARVREHSAAVRGRMLAALPADEEELLVVDLGWAATTQAMLQYALGREGRPTSTVGLYLLTHGVAIGHALRGVEMHALLGEYGEPAPGTDAVMRSPEVLEQLCMPDHGSQVDVDEDGAPLLAAAGAHGAQAAERETVRRGIFAFRRLAEASVPDAALAGPTGRAAAAAILRRSVLGPTEAEARLLGGWLHDENLTSEDAQTVVSGPVAEVVGHVGPDGLTAIPMTDVYWPHAVAALHDGPLAAATELVADGLAEADLFGSEVETGRTAFRLDTGWGFRQQGAVRVPLRRNRRGLSLVRALLRGEEIARIACDLTGDAALVRLDRVRVRAWPTGAAEAVEVALAGDADLDRVGVLGARRLGRGLLVAGDGGLRLVLDLPSLVGARCWRAEVEIACAIVPAAGAAERLRPAGAAARVQARARALGSGVPGRAVGKLATRLSRGRG